MTCVAAKINMINENDPRNVFGKFYLEKMTYVKRFTVKRCPKIDVASQVICYITRRIENRKPLDKFKKLDEISEN